jgi:hypothetical protein
VVPGTAVKQMARHMKNLDPGDAERFAQAAFSNWRKIVLSLSIPWVVGNTAEASLRSALNLVGPRSYLTGRRARRDAPKLAEALGKGKPKLEQERLKTAAALGEARTVGSGRTALVNRAQMHRDATQFDEGAFRTRDQRRQGLGHRSEGRRQAAPDLHEEPSRRRGTRGRTSDADGQQVAREQLSDGDARQGDPQPAQRRRPARRGRQTQGADDAACAGAV